MEMGFRRIWCDRLIEEKLAPQLTGSDGSILTPGEWMGFPYEPAYHEREALYLAREREVLAEILDLIETQRLGVDRDIVVDTGGSIIYVGEDLLHRLSRLTTIVYLSIPEEELEPLLQAYLSKPHPMLWQGWFSMNPGETRREALARSYRTLFAARKKLYEKLAQITIDSCLIRREGFGPVEFLNKLASRMSDSPRLEN